MIAMKIMIVEDEENIRDGIRNLVDWNQEGFEEPLLFSSAVEALGVFRDRDSGCGADGSLYAGAEWN